MWFCRGSALSERGTVFLSVVAASLLVSATSLRSAEPTTEVPFDLFQHHLIVTKGSVGQLNGLSLLIDTGTIPSGS